MRARLESYARTIDRGIARRRRRAVIAQPQLAVAGTAAAGATPAITARRQEILELARDAANEGTGGVMASMEAITREDGDGGGGGRSRRRAGARAGDSRARAGHKELFLRGDDWCVRFCVRAATARATDC